MSEAPDGGNSTGRPQTLTTRGVVDVAVYAVARLLLAVVVSAAIYGVARLAGLAQFPLVVAALFGLIIAMPLGIWVFAPLRRRATAALATAGARRRAEREKLRARLRGEAAPDEGAGSETGAG
ncbi:MULTISPECIES: DUF4229 domain-containing protein [Mycobacterium ulcerans group]|uniref:DUF4229 domain-containing protein n=3 Tax=Mycobacterium ulcerans group TaxID=2993898 RepID=A0A3E2MTP2_MYCMR|nr:conserved hypothetical membrane protein [Mycobacterium ulcerans Agy99]EPQ73789.1 hypothetical protein MMMB2_4561 [Mycobacterium marinum MB2]RFZ38684.1 hypothetical protein DAVIS_03518 [Mycobacterium marinum]BAV43128.1 hypothetical protein SHTP_4183 [Mycobacterium ulcerans subsp. shinshuense]RFZ66159.1 hypothetical protein DE4576_03103 [Mycobacterium marinum]